MGDKQTQADFDSNWAQDSKVRLRKAQVSMDTDRFWDGFRLGKGKIQVELEGVPHDAQLYRISLDMHRDCFILAFRHPSFDEVPEGTEIPFSPHGGIKVTPLKPGKPTMAEEKDAQAGRLSAAFWAIACTILGSMATAAAQAFFF